MNETGSDKTMDPNWWIVAMLITGTFVITSIFWISYGAYKADEMRQQHTMHVERVHESYTMQRQTYGAVPVEKLIGREN